MRAEKGGLFFQGVGGGACGGLEAGGRREEGGGAWATRSGRSRSPSDEAMEVRATRCCGFKQ